MLDMAAMPTNLFDMCSTIHIRVPEETQHDIAVNPGMICIKPSEPANSVLATYREQYFYPALAANAPPQQQHPSPYEAPPPKPVEGGKVESAKPDNLPKAPVASPKEQAPSVQTQEARPAEIPTTAATTTKCSSSMMFVTSTFLTQVTTSVYRGHLSTFITATPSASTSLSSTLDQPPVHIPTPPAAPTAAPPAAAPPVQAPPASPTPPAPVRPAHPDHPAPPHHPAPVYCDAEYFRMDVTTIQTLDPHDLALYLDLLGMGKLGLDLDHGLNGLVGGLLGGAVDDDETRVIYKELEHAYRVRCGVPLPRHEKGKGKKKGKHDKGKGKGKGKGKHERGEEEVEFPKHDKVLTVGSRKECVEECEMGAIKKAHDEEVRECLGAAYHPRLAHENCRYWTGASDEVLPVDELGREETGEWEFVYL